MRDSSLQVLCVIPSRMGSTRLARKPILPIQGKPMVQWVYENASQCSAFSKVIVATDHEEIYQLIQSIGGQAIMTDPDCPTGSDRAAIVAQMEPEMDVVVNLQGDEPFIQPHMLEKLISPYLAGENPDMTTLARPLDRHASQYTSPHSVKVVVDLKGNALYFSRSPLPFFRTTDETLVNWPVYHHMGLYAFRRDALLNFTQLPPSPLEKIELLEQLRMLENGYQIRVCLTEGRTLEINTPEEYEQAQVF